MRRRRAFTRCVLGLAAIFALVAAGCASTAESPEPSAQPRSPGAEPSATVQACPTPPPTPPASVRPTAVASGTGQATLTGVAADATACTDRMTFTFEGGRSPAYDVRYVQSWTTCGSGEPVTTAGAAQLIVQFRDTNAHDEAGNPTAPRSLTPNLASLKEAVQTCDFEADVAWALGTAERYFTVTALHNPERVVVDIYH